MFEIGQKVRVIEGIFGREHCLYIGDKGEIRRDDKYALNRYGVLFDDQRFNWFAESELEPVREANEEQHPQPNQ